MSDGELTMSEMEISLAQAHRRLSHWLRQVTGGPVTITCRGRPVAVIIDPTEYERLTRVRAYLDMLRIASSLQDRGLTADELGRASRAELESR